jgi:ubiquinone/menaquinone biosynthesis C-methylase UbiE
LNLGAGTGSYEPKDIPTVAIEPSIQMIKQRTNRANAVQARAEALPVKDKSFDASMAILTIHHWLKVERGLAEAARAAKRKIVILTWDPDFEGFWLTREYFPELRPPVRRCRYLAGLKLLIGFDKRAGRASVLGVSRRVLQISTWSLDR